MKIFNYHSKTGEYLYEGVADESPLEKNVYLLPACSTSIEPPITGINEVAVFDGKKWLVKSDYREVLLYSTDSGLGVNIFDIGVTPADIQAAVFPRPSPAHEWDKKQSAWVLDENLANDLAMQSQIAAMVSASEAVRERLNFEIDKKSNEISQAVGADFKTAAGLMAFCGYPNQFRAIAEQFGAWTASVWTAANTYKAEVLAGTKPMLTPDEAVALMPEYAE